MLIRAELIPGKLFVQPVRERAISSGGAGSSGGARIGPCHASPCHAPASPCKNTTSVFASTAIVNSEELVKLLGHSCLL